ncbi:MAG: 3-isopropylmalate dehydratase large subunit [Brevinematales bacterium]|nr:3-isopropylmalate dehydratase large subunit [Brevinematales bacterium]
MGMTISQKILAAHAINEDGSVGREYVEPGEIINAKVDFCFSNDVTGPLSIEEFTKAGAEDVFDKTRVALIPDHFSPAKDIKSANQINILRQFARKLNLPYFYEIGKVGIEHTLLVEEGLALPGDVIIGADSHTCTLGALGAFATGMGSTDIAYAMITGETWFKVPESMKFIYYGKMGKWTSSKDLILYTIADIGVDGALYRAMEFTGETISDMSFESRMTMTNMAIEAGAKTGIMEPDEKTIEYIRKQAKREYKIYKSDPDAEYVDVREYDVSKIEPQVAFPHLPSNCRNVSEATHVKIDQVFIGSCTNAKIEDLRIVAEILKGRKVHPEIRCIITPATQVVYYKALKEGLIDIFMEAGAVVTMSTCGPCLGGHMGILGKGEKAVSTTNRNFVGRMGDPTSEVYLASPAVAAASAILGRIAHPEEVLGTEKTVVKI